MNNGKHETARFKSHVNEVVIIYRSKNKKIERERERVEKQEFPFDANAECAD